MRRFLVIFVVSFGLLLATVIALNYIVDPTGLFSKASSQPEVKLAKILAGNSNALIGSNYDERIFQILHAKTETQHAPIIITGSSRMMPVSSAMLAIPCLNVAVSSASLEDHIALGIAAKKRKRNQVFLLGVDPWVFNGNLGPIGWRSIGKDYVKAAKAVHLTEIPVLEKIDNKIFQLINLEYTKASLGLLLLRKNEIKPIRATNDDAPAIDMALIRKDGSRLNSLRTTEQRIDAINKLAIQYGKPPLYNMGNFRLSEKLKSDFLKFVDYLRKDSRVVFVLPPYHPISYPLIIKECPGIGTIEQFLRDEASKRGIPVIGSYDPLKLGCADSDFSDGMHPTTACWEKIFSNAKWLIIAKSFGLEVNSNGKIKPKDHVQ